MSKSLPVSAKKTEDLLRIHNEQDSLIENCQSEGDALTKHLNKIIANFDLLAKAQKKQKTALADYTSKLVSANRENEILLGQLLSTQEELEKATSIARDESPQLENYKRALQRALDSHPNYWCFGDFSVKPNENDSLTKSIEWHFRDAIVGNTHYPHIRFKTILNDGIAGIIVQRPYMIDSPDPLLRWHCVRDQSDEARFIPIKAPFNSGTNANFNKLGPTDWFFLNALVKRLSLFIEHSNHHKLNNIDTSALQNGLILLSNTLNKWPHILRYDQIYLRQVFVTDEHWALEIELINPQLGKYNWSDFRYRIAAVREPGSALHKNPRLEFLPTNKVLQSWPPEEGDSIDACLELRFSAPGLMDTVVWNTLSGIDQILIAALLNNASTQLTMLQKDLETNYQSLDEWLEVCETMRSILANSTSDYSRSMKVEKQT